MPRLGKALVEANAFFVPAIFADTIINVKKVGLYPTDKPIV